MMAPGAGAPVRAVLLDALGTLLELQPPAPRLRAALVERAGVDVGERAAELGFAAEIEHYLANHMRGGDATGLEALRDECADVLRAALDRPELARAPVRAAMLDAIELTPYPDVVPALVDLRERGLRLVVVSNWDCSLPDRLAETGIAALVDGVVSSAVVGAAKPAAAPFAAGLELAGCAAAEAVHVGDSVEQDVAGARAAGVRALLVLRHGGDPPPGVEAVRSLRALSRIL